MAFHTLSIGANALMTARYGLDVTGQNLGNIGTDGYSRQRVNQTGLKGVTGSINSAVIGNGVWVSSVTRIANEQVEKQLRQSVTKDEYYGNLQNCYRNIQSYFNELKGNGLSDAMSTFWNSMEDVSTKVENIGTRSTAINQAQSMVTTFNRLGENLAQYRKDVDDQVGMSVSEINRILGQIATLNKQIVSTENGGLSGVMANDLRDQRGEAVKELYEYMDVDVTEESNGSFIVSLHGRNLVYFDQAKTIVNEKVLSDDGTMVNNPVFASDRYPLQPTDGQLAAQMEMRDTIVKSYKDDIDKLAANFMWEFNRVYSQTRGLETFDTVMSQNTPSNPTATLDKLNFNENVPAGTFEIKNGSFEIIIHNRTTDQPTTVPIEIDLDGRLAPNGEPDTILWDPANPSAENSLVNRMQKALDEAAPGMFEVSIDLENQVSITSKSKEYGFCFGKDSSGVVAALGLNVLFTGYNASSMGVSQNVKDNPKLLGAAYSFTSGDASGLNDIIAIRDTGFDSLQGMSIESYYQSVAGRLGSEASCATSMKTLAEDVLSRMYTQRESLSGVSEDEEVTKMITYQRAFQSAAKFISTVDQLYEVLINM